MDIENEDKEGDLNGGMFPSLLCTILSQPTLFTSKERMIVVDIVYECITCFDNQFFLKNGQAFRHDGILWGVGIKVNMNDSAAVNSHLKLIDVLLEVGDKENKMEELQEFGGIDLVERVAEDEEGDSSEENVKLARSICHKYLNFQYQNADADEDDEGFNDFHDFQMQSERKDMENDG
ncbi:MAG: hypothetical protein EZS28_030983 [Streblomastix strix]|uniref:Uncharacterized protein n=1 Tax=Streblomastix strix TaxID=222440 RepID=A0A5J4UU41_9EUKA|nr:MAG: hypothetical protein EZS28_030983 [Streblomastix strix]